MHLAVKSRRGMTLAEIMVALGMVAIMIVMVVSFVLLLSNRTQNNNALQSIQQDRQRIQAGVENWMDAVAGQRLRKILLSLHSSCPSSHSLFKVLYQDTATLHRSFTSDVMRHSLPGILSRCRNISRESKPCKTFTNSGIISAAVSLPD